MHCEHGVSRSATIVAAYLVAKRGICAVEGLRFIRGKRACICPNERFLEALGKFQGGQGGKAKLKKALKEVCSRG